jgi:hypothetical protein
MEFCLVQNFLRALNKIGVGLNLLMQDVKVTLFLYLRNLF